MVTFLEVPYDIHHLIAGWLDTTDLRNLRHVHPVVRDVPCSRLFVNLKLHITHLCECLRLLQGSGHTNKAKVLPALQYVRHVQFSETQADEDKYEMAQKMLSQDPNIFFSNCPSLATIKFSFYKANVSKNPWATLLSAAAVSRATLSVAVYLQKRAVRGLDTLSNVYDLDILHFQMAQTPISPTILARIARAISNSPNLHSLKLGNFGEMLDINSLIALVEPSSSVLPIQALEVDVWYSEEHDTLSRLSKLQSLILPNMGADIWPHLQPHCPELSHISTYDLSPGLINLLGSGFLRLTSLDIDIDDGSMDHLASEFWNAVKCHTTTLKKLKVSATLIGPYCWTPGSLCRSIIQECHQLRSLAISADEKVPNDEEEDESQTKSCITELVASLWNHSKLKTLISTRARLYSADDYVDGEYFGEDDYEVVPQYDHEMIVELLTSMSRSERPGFTLDFSNSACRDVTRFSPGLVDGKWRFIEQQLTK